MEKICDRVGIIIGGRLVALDTVSALVKGRDLEDVFFDIYARQTGGAV